MKRKKIKIYLDGVDYQHEVGYAAGGNTVYASLNDLKKYNSCWEQCGVVVCELVLKKWVEKQDFSKMAKRTKTYTAKELKKNEKLVALEYAKIRLEKLEKMVADQNQRILELRMDLKKKGK